MINFQSRRRVVRTRRSRSLTMFFICAPVLPTALRAQLSLLSTRTPGVGNLAVIDAGPVPGSQPLQLTVRLAMTSGRSAALDQLLAAHTTSSSPSLSSVAHSGAVWDTVRQYPGRDCHDHGVAVFTGADHGFGLAREDAPPRLRECGAGAERVFRGASPVPGGGCGVLSLRSGYRTADLRKVVWDCRFRTC